MSFLTNLRSILMDFLRLYYDEIVIFHSIAHRLQPMGYGVKKFSKHTHFIQQLQIFILKCNLLTINFLKSVS